jgi:hypothetical protein
MSAVSMWFIHGEDAALLGLLFESNDRFARCETATPLAGA